MATDSLSDRRWERLRRSLIEQIRDRGIGDLEVLQVFDRVPRHLFLPESVHNRAYEDAPLPIGFGQTASQPSLQALYLQTLQLQPHDKVLEIGTGSGYQCAVLARLARRVYTIERHRLLLAEAEARFAELRLPNITTRCGDGSRGWPEQAPFDRIMITAAAPEMPYALIGQLTEGGILVAPIGPERGDQELYRITRTADGENREWLCSVRFVPLIAGPAPDPRDAVAARSRSYTASRTRT